MPRSTKVTLREERRQSMAPPGRRPAHASSFGGLPAASGNMRRSRNSSSRGGNSGGSAGLRRKAGPAPKPKPTGYDSKRGWLTPWKKIQYPVSPLPTLREAAIIETWKANQRAIRDGPLFVRRVVDSNARIGKSTASTSSFDAFNSLPTYTAKYERRYRQRPKLDGKLWLKEILPRELWDVVDPSLRKDRNANRVGPEKATQTRFNIDDFSDNEEAVVDDENADDSNAEAEAEADEVDEDWEDDEDEADDYNGEKYFDDGEKDDFVEDDYEAGDDMGGGEMEHEREFAPGEEFDV